MMEQIIEFFNQMPSYMGEGIVQIFVTLICGLVLGWLTSRYFSRKNEVIRVEGLLLEKKLPIYGEIVKRVGTMNNMCVIASKQVDAALMSLNKCGFDVEKTPTSNQINQIFDDPDEFARQYLAFDQYCSDNKIYFDDITNYPIMFFQNYLAFFHRFNVMFTDAVNDMGGNASSENNKKIKRGLFLCLGILFKDEFYEQTQTVEEAIRKFYNNPTLSHRSDPNYSYEFFSAEDGYLTQRLNNTIAGKEENRSKVMELITMYAAMGVIKG